jgi:hypothetical protein
MQMILLFGALIFLMYPENLQKITRIALHPMTEHRQALLWEAFFVDCLGLGH